MARLYKPLWRVYRPLIQTTSSSVPDPKSHLFSFILHFVTELFLCVWSLFGIKCHSDLFRPNSVNCPYPKEQRSSVFEKYHMSETGIYFQFMWVTAPPTSLQPLAEWGGSSRNQAVCKTPSFWFPQSEVHVEELRLTLELCAFDCRSPLIRGYFPIMNTSGQHVCAWLNLRIQRSHGWNHGYGGQTTVSPLHTNGFHSESVSVSPVCL